MGRIWDCLSLGITAGLWSNRYLRDIDNEIFEKFENNHEYYRYADDMAVIADEDKIDSLIEVVQTSLSRLGLTLTLKKASSSSISVY